MSDAASINLCARLAIDKRVNKSKACGVAIERSVPQPCPGREQGVAIGLAAAVFADAVDEEAGGDEVVVSRQARVTMRRPLYV